MLLWTHYEHQARPEKFMPIRVAHYQCGKLLEYAKLNKCDKLPPIITVIYYQGIKPYIYPVELNALFSEPELAEQYFTKPILVDLPSLPDQEVESHPSIGAAELLLKHIRSQKFPQRYHGIIQKIAVLDDKTRHILIQYLIQRADLNEKLLFEAILDHLTRDKEIAMTVAEQISQRNIKQGMQQGMQQEKHQIAKNMLAHGLDSQLISNTTGLDLQAIAMLKKDMQH